MFYAKALTSIYANVAIYCEKFTISVAYLAAWIGIIRLRISFVIIPICSMSLPISSTFLMSSKSDTSLTLNICKYITIKGRHTMIMRL